MADVRRGEGLVEHQRRGGKPRIDVAVLPLVGRLAEGHLALAGRGEVGLGPFQLADDAWRERVGAVVVGLPLPDVAVGARVGAAGAKAPQRIDDERQRLVLDDDPLDRFGGSALVDRGNREDRLALVQRLVGEGALVVRIVGDRHAKIGHAARRLRQIVGRDDRLDARQRQRGAGVEPPDARVRQRAQQLFREQHPVRAEVFGVLRAAGDFRHHVVRDVVLPNELRIGHRSSPFAIRGGPLRSALSRA